MVETFPMGEALKFGWGAMKRNISFFIIILIVGLIIYVVPEFLTKKLGKEAPLIALVIVLAAWVVQAVVSLGYTQISLKLCDENKPEIGDVFSAYPYFLKFVISSLLYAGLYFLTFIPSVVVLLIGHYLKNTANPLSSIFMIAGFATTFFLMMYVVTIFWFYIFIIVDKNAGPVEALKKSAAMTKGYRFKIFLFFLAVAGVNIVGFLALVIGLFASIPTTMVASAYLYRKLDLSADSQAPQGGM